jgi:hypothetical protein
MRSPHRNDPNDFAAPCPDQSKECTLDLADGFPPFLAVARGRLVDDGTAIEEKRRRRKVERPFLDDPGAFPLVPFEVRSTYLTYVHTFCKYNLVADWTPHVEPGTMRSLNGMPT